MAKLTNEQKFKTAEERVKAFNEWRTAIKCEGGSYLCDKCKAGPSANGCEFKWLALEAEEEKPENCPFCGDKGEVHLIKIDDPKENFVRCARCFYSSPHCDYAEDAIAEHNRVARAVRAAEKGDAK